MGFNLSSIFVQTPHTSSNYIIGRFIYKAHFLNMLFSASGEVGFVCFRSLRAFKRNTKEGFAVNQINALVSIFDFFGSFCYCRGILAPVMLVVVCLIVYTIRLHAFQYL